jgi:4-hydroxy-tetrahydrodipicolinate reductase
MTTASAVKIAVAGAMGRMGQAVTAALDQRAAERGDVRVCALFDRAGTEGASLGGRVLTSAQEASEAAQVLIDFTVPTASAALARACSELRVPGQALPALIIGSTGFDAEDQAVITQAARRMVIVQSGNFSLGVNMLMGLVRQAARALDPEAYDIEVTEAHHKRKIDAPSGTALMLGQAAAAGRGIDLAERSDRARDGLTGPRRTGDIGFSVVRGGGIIGEHSVIFAAEDEILTLAHSARDRGLFARGAVAAALWAVSQTRPGLYDMQDVLGMGR